MAKRAPFITLVALVVLGVGSSSLAQGGKQVHCFQYSFAL